HLFTDILFLVVCASIAGAQGWEDIEDFGDLHFNWFAKKGLFKNGLPVHDTIARVISRIDSEQFQYCFIDWMKSVAELSDGQLIAIDGKRLCGSYNRENRLSAIHMVNAFATENNVVLGQVKTESKSNEITAIPALLALLDIKGCLISIDAMGCQTDIAEQIIERGGDYLLAVKGNQKTLHNAVRKALGSEIDEEVLCLEKQHGRNEARAYCVMDAGSLADAFPEWKGLKSIGVALSYRRTKSGNESLEYRYYISSAKLSKARFANAVRSHWAVENSLHWVLDASMKEDQCQIYRGNAAEVLSGARKIALNMLRAETTRKISIPRKQKRAHGSTDYLEQVLTAGLKTLGDI
ncbi:ISAs1 family transposase, partial [Vibrio anguillarum]